MLSEADRKKAADILIVAQKDRKQATQLHITFPTITIEDSYAISTEVANRKIKAGARMIGHKVGLTSKAMQRSSMIDEPDYGYILDDQLIADGAKLKHADYCKPRVEIELAFIMSKKLQGPGVGLSDVLRATEYVIPAIEIVDARIQDQRKIVDTVADNGAAAGIAMGGRADGCRSALGRRHHVSQCGDRGDRSRRGRTRPSGARCCLACQQDRPARACARAGTYCAGGVVHPCRFRAEGGYAAPRFRVARRRFHSTRF